jgi:hypothetical protein
MSVKIKTNTPETSQMDSFQNATLHSVNDEIACSIAVHPAYPGDIKTEEQAKAYLQEKLRALSDEGWHFDIQLGESMDFEQE